MSDLVERLCNLAAGKRVKLHTAWEAADEIERLRRIETAARRAFDYHMRGYRSDASDFDANDQLALMDALGRALEGK